MNKYRIFYKPKKKYADDCFLFPNGDIYDFKIASIAPNQEDYIAEMCTGLEDRFGNVLYE